jgi:uncharacterized membrane protein
MRLTYPRGKNMEEIFKKSDALKEEAFRLEEENKKLLLWFQKREKLNESIERTVLCVIFAVIIVVSIIPAGWLIALITASFLLIPAVLFHVYFVNILGRIINV